MARRETRQELEARLREMESELEEIYDRVGDLLGIEPPEPEDDEENGDDETDLT